MVNLDTLDTLIAVVVVLLVLSLVVQSIQAAIKKFFRVKSLQLEQSLVHLFYYALGRDALETMTTAAGRLPLLGFLLGRKKTALIPDEAVRALYDAVAAEFRRAGRITPGNKLLLESAPKEDLLKFLCEVRVDALLAHDPEHNPQSLAELNRKIAEARETLDRLTGAHRELIDQTPLAKLELPLRHLLSNASQFLSAGAASFTLGELAKFGAAEIAEARRLLAELPTPLRDSLAHLEQNAQQKAAAELRQLQMALEPLHAQFDRVVALPHKFSQIKTRLEDWYDTIMRSFDERYTRSMRSFSIGISFVVVLLLNANLFSLYREISANAAQRELILQSSETIRAELRNRQNASPADVDLTIEQWKRESLDDINRQVSLYTSLGFEGPAWLRHPIAHFQKNGVFHSLAGWIVMALLLSAGAPFWQDTLESLFGLKNLLRKRGKPELSADNPERVR
jgi:hypothetical protein